MLIHININGEKKKIHCQPDDMLFDALRGAGYKSVKCGCSTTNCGLCTVWLDGVPVLSCSVPAVRCTNRNVTTLEGVMDEVEVFGKLMVQQGAEQCGFCSPGLIMSVIAMKKEFIAAGNTSPTEEDINHYLAGNLCRCSGYMSQMRAIKNYVEVV